MFDYLEVNFSTKGLANFPEVTSLNTFLPRAGDCWYMRSLALLVNPQERYQLAKPKGTSSIPQKTEDGIKKWLKHPVPRAGFLGGRRNPPKL